MINSPRWGVSIGMAVLALALVGSAADAQQKAPDAKTGAAAPAAKTAVKKVASPCAGLEEAGCKANTLCTWYRETTTKKGTKRKAHCQKKPAPKKK